MGGGNGDAARSEWLKPLAPPVNLRELEQLRMLVMHEFNPPPSTPELLAALRTCGNRTREAYLHLKAARGHPSATANAPSAVTTTLDPSSAPAEAPGTMRSDGTPEREREKRRMSALSTDNGTPNKKRKELASLAAASESMDVDNDEEKDLTPPTLQGAANNVLDDEEKKEETDELSEADRATAQRVLLETVEDRVDKRSALRHPEWTSAVWTALQVSADLELSMKLNLTVDALATWVKKLDGRKAQVHQTQGVALVVDVVANLPHVTAVGDHVVCTPSDADLTQQDEKVTTVMQAEKEAGEKSAYVRSGAAKDAIECLSAACQLYMTRLDWVRRANEQNSEQQAAVRRALSSLDEKLTELMAQSSREVHEADKALHNAKLKKETRSKQLLEFVEKRHKELVDAGESDASAHLQSTVEVYKANDDEVRALWSAHSESGVRVAECVQAQQTANSALAFYQNLMVLFRSVRERRETSLQEAIEKLEETRTSSEARATRTLETYVPWLTGALFRYYEFHSVQQAKAKEEQREQEKALEAHMDYFGDSAPIKKDDIEKRIHEFSGVITSSTQVIREIAADQCKLWGVEQAILPRAVRHTLVREFKELWKRLSGPMRDVMRNVVVKVEENLSGSPRSPVKRVSSPVFVQSQQLPQPVFTVPKFSMDGPATVTTYRTAISAVVAPNEAVEISPHSMAAAQEDEDEAMTPSGDASGTSEWVSVSPEASTTTTVNHDGPNEPPAPATSEQHQDIGVGAVLYSKFVAGENGTQFLRGEVVKLLGNGIYQMQYDNGEKFTAPSSHLFTKEQMEEDLRKSGGVSAAQDANMENEEVKTSDGGCAIM